MAPSLHQNSVKTANNQSENSLYYSNIILIRVLVLTAAMSTADSPCILFWLISLPFSTRNLMASDLPFPAAQCKAVPVNR